MNKAKKEAGFEPRRFRPYPKYKDSGVEWLGMIPEHWETKRLRSTIISCQNGVWGDEPDGVHNLICVRVADFDRVGFRVDITKPTLRSIDLRIAADRRIQSGDLLLEKSGGGEQQPVGVVVMYDHDTPAVCSNFIARVTIAPRHNARYLTYLHASLYAQRLNTRHIKQSTGIQNLDSPSYFSESVVLPKITEQGAIAAFLDRETAKIDALIEKKERLVELLQEKRTALITQAVTKGLDPTVPMKDSGVEWLGMIPEHWEIKRLKRIVDFQGGGTPSKDNLDYWRGDILWVSPKDMKVPVILDTEDKITPQAIRESATKLIPRGAVLIVVRSGILIHNIPIALSGRELTLNQDLKALLPHSELFPEYLSYMILGKQKELLTEWKKEGATVESLEIDLIAQTHMLLPDRLEQRTIAVFLDRETEKIDALITKIREAIALLKEYRSALISAAVTGKIDVREEATGESAANSY